MVNDSDFIFFDDGGEVYLDIGNDKSTIYGPNDYQIQFGFDDPSVVIGNGNNLSNSTKAQNTTSDGYRIELAIPWSSLNTTPSEGTLLGFDVHAQDDDDGGERDTKFSFAASEDVSFSDPSSFGTARLVNGNGGTPDPSPDPEVFYIKQRASGQYLVPETTQVASRIILADKDDSDLFKWQKFEGTSQGFFFLRNVATGQHFRPVTSPDDPESYDSGNSLETMPSETTLGPRTQWRLENIPNDDYGYLINLHATGYHFRPATNTDRNVILRPSDSYRGFEVRWLFEPVQTSESSSNLVVSTSFSKANTEMDAELQFYPNPVQGILYITDRNEGFDYDIFDLKGIKVLSGNFAKNDGKEIDLSSLVSGTYVVRMGDKSIKIVKQ